MKTLSITTERLDFLDKLFAPFNPQLSKIEFIGMVSVFSFCFETEEALNDNWEAVTNAIAAYYQAEFDSDETEFERWNIYLFFIVGTAVSQQLKCKIENNKFSTRKIVQDNVPNVLNDEFIIQMIEEYITNSDLTCMLHENQQATDSAAYTSDSVIYRLIENRMGSLSSRTTNKEDIEQLYQQIINQIENEVQKN